MNTAFYESISTYKKLNFTVSFWCGCHCFLPIRSLWKAHERVVLPSEFFRVQLTVLQRHPRMATRSRAKMHLAEHSVSGTQLGKCTRRGKHAVTLR